MPRFYFDVRRDGAPIRTRKMIARAEAAPAAVDMVRATGRPGASDRGQRRRGRTAIRGSCPVQVREPARLGVASFTCTRTRAECGHASEVAARAEAA